MLYYLHMLGTQHPELSFLRLIRFVTFRASMAGLTGFLLVLFLGPLTIRLLRRFQAISPPRLEGLAPNDQIAEIKRRVPSMGGILIVVATLIAIHLWAIPNQALVLIFGGLMLGMGIIGFLDDYLKVKKKSRDGMSGRTKFICQIILAIIAVWLLDQVPEAGGYVRKLMLPFFTGPVVNNLPLWLAIGIGVLVVVGSSNAVNLTDGMDGLAIGCTVICSLAYAVFAYVCGHFETANYLRIPFLPGSSEVTVIACAMAGAGMGFLWHNCYPAGMFMGDTGSLALGGAIGLIAVLVKQELILVVIGGIFVVEAGSVILQVSFFKLTRRLTGEPRRLFLCAPYHHHLQRKGWTETQVVVRFWILAAVLAGCGLATLKIR